MKKVFMEMPKFERQEKAGCIGCAALAAINPAMVSLLCGITIPGIAA